MPGTWSRVDAPPHRNFGGSNIVDSVHGRRRTLSDADTANSSLNGAKFTARQVREPHFGKCQCSIVAVVYICSGLLFNHRVPPSICFPDTASGPRTHRCASSCRRTAPGPGKAPSEIQPCKKLMSALYRWGQTHNRGKAYHLLTQERCPRSGPPPCRSR